MSIHTTLYNAIFRRTSTMALVVAASTFFFERTFEIGCEECFKCYNKGKLYADMVKDKE